jgi:hypothetical protein
MHLRDVHVQNIKLLRDVALSFVRKDGTPRPFTMFVGENGLCKTTLLQAIAVATVGPDYGSNLAASVQQSWIDLRGEGAAPTIRASLRNSDMATSEMKVSIEARRASFSGQATFALAGRTKSAIDVDQLGDRLREQKARWFSAAYGTSRGDGKREAGEAGPLRSLRSLFEGPLDGVSLIDLLEPKLARKLVKTLQQIFVTGGLLPGITDLELRGRGGVRIAEDFQNRFTHNGLQTPVAWLSQGYRSTIAWVADFVGQLFLAGGDAVEPADMEGIVLIDEIDLHLHPRWQVALVPALKRVFPKMQFVATTHSPMMLTGLDADEIFLLERDKDGNVTARCSDENPALRTGTELYSQFFGIEELYPNELGKKVDRYGELANDAYRSDAEEKERATLEKELARAQITFDWRPVRRKKLASLK